MWQRWNQITHIFEVSSNEGASWSPLPLNGSIINEGTIGSGFVPAAPPSAHRTTHETGGTDALTALSGAILTTGVIPDARHSSNVPLKNANNIFSGTNQFGSSGAPAVAGDISVSRNSAPTTGAVFFGNTSSNYLFFNATAIITPNPVSSTGQFRANASRNSAHNVLTATFTAISFDTENYDIGNCWTPGNPTAIFCPPGGDGFFAVLANIAFSANSTGNRFARLAKNGGIFYQQYYPTMVGDQTLFQLFALTPMVAGDYMQVVLYQTSGATLDANGTSLTVAKLW